MDNSLYDRLISLNIAIEGNLRVAAARGSEEALAMAKENFDRFAELFPTLLKEKEAPAPEATDIKEEEAEGAEEAPLAEPDEADVPADEPIAESDLSSVEAAMDEEPAPAAKPRGDIRKMLTLNDKFLFRRELFNGSDTELNDTLELIASMHSSAEAREYLFDDLQWDPEAEAVNDFLALVDNYFG